MKKKIYKVPSIRVLPVNSACEDLLASSSPGSEIGNPDPNGDKFLSPTDVRSKQSIWDNTFEEEK